MYIYVYFQVFFSPPDRRKMNDSLRLIIISFPLAGKKHKKKLETMVRFV
jgi:hypothetical protein